MSDTPRTDRMVASWPLERFGEMTGLARQLERENATLRKQLAERERSLAQSRRVRGGRMNAKQMIAKLDGYGGIIPFNSEELEVTLRALRLLDVIDGAAGETPAAWIEHHKGGDNLVWDKSRHDCTPLYTGAAFAKVKDERNAALKALEEEREDAERWQAHQRLTWKTQKEADAYQAAIDAARGTK